MNQCFQIKKPPGQKSPGPPSTDLLSGKHVLFHEVFDLLEDSPAFGRLQEQDIFSGTRDGAGTTYIELKKREKDAKFHLLLAESAGGIDQCPLIPALMRSKAPSS